jgi:hypothetical protein
MVVAILPGIGSKGNPVLGGTGGFVVVHGLMLAFPSAGFKRAPRHLRVSQDGRALFAMVAGSTPKSVSVSVSNNRAGRLQDARGLPTFHGLRRMAPGADSSSAHIGSSGVNEGVTDEWGQTNEGRMKTADGWMNADEPRTGSVWGRYPRRLCSRVAISLNPSASMLR